MSVTFQRAQESDLPALTALFDAARRFMAETGNPNQWKPGTPSEEELLEAIHAGKFYLCLAEQTLAAAFYYDFGADIDPTYRKIDGAWHSDAPYGVLHRVAVSPAFRGKGVAGACFDWAFAQCGHLRIDTHDDNKPMQRALEKHGFRHCGTIYLADGAPRRAYDKLD